MGKGLSPSFHKKQRYSPIGLILIDQDEDISHRGGGEIAGNSIIVEVKILDGTIATINMKTDDTIATLLRNIQAYVRIILQPHCIHYQSENLNDYFQ